MPIYEYRCKACQDRFEAIRPVGDRGKSVTCPECGARGAEKLPSVFAAAGGCGATAAGGGGGGGGFT